MSERHEGNPAMPGLTWERVQDLIDYYLERGERPPAALVALEAALLEAALAAPAEAGQAGKPDEAGRVYGGERTPDGDWRVFVEAGGRRRPLRHIVHHSPSGLSWGYQGSGPADTALSILADALGERPSRDELRHGEPTCWRWHQPFKREVIARLPMEEGFRLSLAEVLAWIAARRAAEGRTGAER